MNAQLANYIDTIGMISGIYRQFSMDEIGRADRCMKKNMSALEAASVIFA